MGELANAVRATIARIDAMDVATAKTEGLGRAATLLCEAVRQSLSEPPGGQHNYPWLRTGALRASVGVTIEGDVAVVGSDATVAVYQEQGTAKLPPRPFLAPNAARHADAMVDAVGDAVRGVVR